MSKIGFRSNVCPERVNESGEVRERTCRRDLRHVCDFLLCVSDIGDTEIA